MNDIKQVRINGVARELERKAEKAIIDLLQGFGAVGFAFVANGKEKTHSSSYFPRTVAA